MRRVRRRKEQGSKGGEKSIEPGANSKRVTMQKIQKQTMRGDGRIKKKKQTRRQRNSQISGCSCELRH